MDDEKFDKKFDDGNDGNDDDQDEGSATHRLYAVRVCFRENAPQSSFAFQASLYDWELKEIYRNLARGEVGGWFRVMPETATPGYGALYAFPRDIIAWVEIEQVGSDS